MHRPQEHSLFYFFDIQPQSSYSRRSFSCALRHLRDQKCPRRADLGRLCDIRQVQATSASRTKQSFRSSGWRHLPRCSSASLCGSLCGPKQDSYTAHTPFRHWQSVHESASTTTSTLHPHIACTAWQKRRPTILPKAAPTVQFPIAATGFAA